MTAALLFVPMSPPGASPARPAQGEGSTDVAGLFALLLAGAQPVQASVAAGVQPTSRPPLAPALTGAAAPRAVAPTPTPQTAVPLNPGAVGPAAATPPAEAAQPLPAATAVPGQAGIGEGTPLPQLGPPTQEVPSPEAVAAQAAERTRTAAVAHPMLDERANVIRPGPGDAVAPQQPAITGGQPLPTLPSDAAQMLQAAPKREVQVAPIVDAQEPIRPDGWSRQTTAARRVTGAPAAAPHVPSPSTTASRETGTPAPLMARPNASTFAAMSPGPAAEQLAVNDQGGFESTFEALETVLGRSEQSAADPMRPPSPGRAAPPAPMFQIGVQIARAVPARIDRLFVQLEPAALGRVEVRLEFHRDNQVSAMIAAERPETLDALQRDARLLERSLHDAGLRLDSDGLTFSLKREQAQDQAREHAPFALPADDAGDQTLLTRHHDEPPPLHWFDGLRMLDIRI